MRGFIDLCHGPPGIEFQEEFHKNLAARPAAAKAVNLLVSVEVIDEFVDDGDFVTFFQAPVDQISQGTG